MIGDPDLKVAKALTTCCRPPSRAKASAPQQNNATVRTVFVIGPDKKIKLMLFYPMTTGRNFDELLRVIDSMQLTSKHKVATPAKLEAGPGRDHRRLVSDDDAKKQYPAGWKAPKPYLRDRPAAEIRLCRGNLW